MIFAGSLQAPITFLRPMVRNRTHTVVPGSKPVRVALPPWKIPAGFLNLAVWFCFHALFPGGKSLD